MPGATLADRGACNSLDGHVPTDRINYNILLHVVIQEVETVHDLNVIRFVHKIGAEGVTVMLSEAMRYLLDLKT